MIPTDNEVAEKRQLDDILKMLFQHSTTTSEGRKVSSIKLEWVSLQSNPENAREVRPNVTIQFQSND